LPVNDRLRHELCDEDDDIFLDDSGHYHTEGVDVQLPYLQTVLDQFDIVPIVMGDESPEFCRELGHAVGEVAYNRRVLVVATMDVLDASEAVWEEFADAFEATDVSRLMALFNSERMRVAGKGAVLVAVIAALHRRATKARILTMEPAQDNEPGYVGAVLWRA
jgi:AmmeMemoRadiSam system protein B